MPSPFLAFDPARRGRLLLQEPGRSIAAFAQDLSRGQAVETTAVFRGMTPAWSRAFRGRHTNSGVVSPVFGETSRARGASRSDYGIVAGSDDGSSNSNGGAPRTAERVAPGRTRSTPSRIEIVARAANVMKRPRWGELMSGPGPAVAARGRGERGLWSLAHAAGNSVVQGLRVEPLHAQAALHHVERMQQ